MCPRPLVHLYPGELWKGQRLSGAAKEREDHGTDLQVMARILFGDFGWLKYVKMRF